MLAQARVIPSPGLTGDARTGGFRTGVGARQRLPLIPLRAATTYCTTSRTSHEECQLLGQHSEAPASRNGRGVTTYEASGPTSSARHPLRRLKIAVDVDEVLGRFLASLNKFYHEEHGRSYDVSDYHLYDFAKVWQCSPEASNHTVHAFFKSDHFARGIQPIPGAADALRRLRAVADLAVVTSRQHCIEQPTLHWLQLHFPEIFSSIHFGNHYALEGTSQKKVDMCLALEADILIDDNPVYAEECAAEGIRVFLFDWEASYPWATTDSGPQHSLITRVHDWHDVEREVAGLVGSGIPGAASGERRRAD